MSDVFASPQPTPLPSLASLDVDNDHVPKPNAWIFLAVAANIVSGLLGVTYAFQMMVFIRFYDLGWLGPWTFGAVSVVIMILGAALNKARPPIAFALIGVAVLNVLIAVAWHAYALWHTLFSPLGILWMLLGVPAAILSALAVGRVLEISRFRRRLMEGV